MLQNKDFLPKHSIDNQQDAVSYQSVGDLFQIIQSKIMEEYGVTYIYIYIILTLKFSNLFEVIADWSFALHDLRQRL